MFNPAAEPDNSTALADAIARDLQSGLLAPGMWLKQIELESRYGASRPSVRRALDQLVQSRLVRHIANRGYFAFEPDDRTDAEIAEIRVAVESTAAARIVARATEADIAALSHLADVFAGLIRTGTLMELSEANQHFHRRMLALCDNLELGKLIQSLRQRISAAPVSQWRTQQRIEASAAEHHAMVAAIAMRDPAELRQIMARHILQDERGAPD